MRKAIHLALTPLTPSEAITPLNAGSCICETKRIDKSPLERGRGV
jgi:hypothetical protein